jgi:hypothetical protein
MKRLQLSAIPVFALLFVWQPSTVLAFSRDGHTWSGASTTLSLNSTSFPAGSAFNLNAQFAMSDWNRVIGSRFRFSVNSTGCNSGNHLPLSDNCVGFRHLGRGVLGRTTSWGLPGFLGGRFLNADVQFNLDYPWTPGLDVDDFSSPPPYSFRGVARHEFGHVLGLCHEDRAGNVVVMNSNYTVGGYVKPANLHWDDRNGVRTLYPAAGTERDLIAYMWKKTTSEILECKSSPNAPVQVNRIPAMATAGDPVTMEYSFENAGNLASGSFNIAFLLSTDNIISLSDTLIAENVGASASAHSRGTFTRTLNIPSDTPAGTYFLGICLDPAGSVPESDKGNNCAVAPGSIVISGSVVVIP